MIGGELSANGVHTHQLSNLRASSAATLPTFVASRHAVAARGKLQQHAGFQLVAGHRTTPYPNFSLRVQCARGASGARWRTFFDEQRGRASFRRGTRLSPVGPNRASAPEMILCGTDLTPSSQAAMHAAAALACKQDAKLLLVSVLKHESVAARHDAEQQLARAAAELGRTHQIQVETCVLHGLPDEELLNVATKRQARLIVVGATTAAGSSPSLGAVPERLCQRAVIPVLLVRESASFLAWSKGQRALRAVMGSGMGDASKSALGCIGSWPELALTVLHVAWPYGEHYRLGVPGPLPRDHLLPEVERRLLGDLGRWAMEITCRATPKLRVIAGLGRVDFHLEQCARDNDADLLVVGTHERNLHDPIWQSSVSRSAIHGTARNVLCVPERYMPPRSASAPRVIVVPTDFTALADRAIAFAASLLDRGGALHVLHVALELPEGAHAALASELSRRIPKDLEQRGVASELRVLQGNPAWLAISQHAARAHADLICMATHSRDAGQGFVLGSQAKALLQHAQIPVLLVPQDRES